MNNHSNGDAHHAEIEADETVSQVGADELESADTTVIATVATIGVVGVGVAMVEAALLPGVLLGVAAVAAPKYLPRLGSALVPVFRSTVRGVYKATQKTRELVAEAQEHVGDIVAEVEAESAATAEDGAAPSGEQKI